MDSESDRKNGKSAYAGNLGRVVEDESGRRVWQGTIRHVKLTLMKTGTYLMSKAQKRLVDPSETPSHKASDDPDEDLEIAVDIGDCDPRDTTKE